MKVTVGRKLIGGFLIVLVLAGVVGWAGLNLARSANEDTRAIFRDEVVGLVGLSRTVADANEVRRRGLEHVLVPTQEEKRTLEEDIDGLVSEFEEDVANLEREWAGQDRKLAALGVLRSRWDAYSLQRERALDLSRAGKTAQARAATTGPTSQAFREVNAALTDLVQVNEDRARATLEDAESSFDSGRNLVLAIISAAVLAGLAIAVVLARSIAGNVGRVAAAAERLAQGDLSQRARVTSRDEVASMAHAFNAMAERLEGMVEEERRSREVLQSAVGEYSTFAAKVSEGDLTVRLSSNGSEELDKLAGHLNGMAEGLGDMSGQVLAGAQSIGTAATQILATVSQHTASASQQSAAINETTATIDEIRAAAEQVVEKARDVARRAQTSADESDEASRAVDAIVGGMDDIRERVDTIAQGILELSEQTQRIGEITSTVDDLADQSNLLALNATIEAAKAGEQGKGFAVVADEVRNLAEQSKQAATQVRVILGEIRKSTDTAVMSTEQGTRVVEEGAGLAHRAGELIQQLAEVIREGAEAAQQITASAHQQSVGMDQIAQAMNEINQGTTQFVSGAEQSQRAAEDLNALARQLQGLTERYKV
jgi:methyl-accepting chemotaxis protein